MSGYDDSETERPKTVTRRAHSLADFHMSGGVTHVGTGASPASYSPNLNATSTSRGVKNVSFGRGPRFADNRHLFISNNHSSDSMGQHSPGPKYNPDFRNNRVPGLSWGPPQDPVKQRQREILRQKTLTSDVGPAAYTPKLDAVRSVSPRPVFGKSARFVARRMDALHANSSPQMQHGLDHTSQPTNQEAFKRTVREPPSFSFGPASGPDSDHMGGTNSVFGAGSNRTAFLTHSIRGGLAKPATLDSGIGPADYVPEGGWRHTMLPRNQPEFSFARSDRFIRDDLLFISRQHSKSKVGAASPGPCYHHEQSDVGHKKHLARSSTSKWLP